MRIETTKITRGKEPIQKQVKTSINEVSISRKTHQIVKLEIHING